jgi:hypothetical protein
MVLLNQVARTIGDFTRAGQLSKVRMMNFTKRVIITQMLSVTKHKTVVNATLNKIYLKRICYSRR